MVFLHLVRFWKIFLGIPLQATFHPIMGFSPLKLLKIYGLATEPQLEIFKIRIVINRIHKTAIIGDKSILGENIEVGPYAIIEDGSTIGNNCVIHSHSVIKKGG